jgi:hypothetical protein
MESGSPEAAVSFFHLGYGYLTDETDLFTLDDR